MNQSPPTIAQLLESQIQTLALTLRPASVEAYRSTCRRFLCFLSHRFPQVQHLADLRRDPHLLGWFRSHCDQRPPLSPKTRHNYLLNLRRLLEDLLDLGHLLQPQLILQQDLPLLPRYLPKPLSSSDDQLLQQELLLTDDLPANTLLLIRATGLRIGECIDLSLDCLRSTGEREYLLHVPLGKLRTERWVPADEDVEHIIVRIMTLRTSNPLPPRPNGEGLLLPCCHSRSAFRQVLAAALQDAGERAGCSTHLTPHRLRHSFASEMVRLGVGLPALMQMMGHNDIRMTLRYVEVTQLDLQREYQMARHKAAQPHRMPPLPVPNSATIPAAGLPGIYQTISTTRHLLEIYRRGLEDEKNRRRLLRLEARLLAITVQLKNITTAEK